MEYVLAMLTLMIVGGIALIVIYDTMDVQFFLGVSVAVIGGVFLVVASIATLQNRHDSAEFIEKYEILDATIKYNRGIGMSEFERIALNEKIAEYNEILAKYKYANEGHFYDIAVVDEVSKLEYLK
ncbi:hypothetical protein Z3_56 [Bacillus phage Z3]|nr:hypothetical protein Z3_56 [Bacillus phage Z3]